jgi:AcrR family transcriptional regulator
MPRTSPARPRPRVRARLEVDERRAQLLALGVRVFSERPYDDVSIDEVAREAGVSKGLLYHYYPTKRDYYVAALRETAGQLVAEVTAPGGEASPEERARRGLATYLGFVERRGKAYVALLRGGIGSDPEVAAVLEETRRAILGLLLAELPGEASKAPLVRAALRGFIGFVEAMSVDWVAHPGASREALVALASSVLTDALRAAALAVLAAPAKAPASGAAAKKAVPRGRRR